jgi:hypothetical protein
LWCEMVGKRGGVEVCEVLDGVKTENGRVKEIDRNIEFSEEVKVEKWGVVGFFAYSG